MHDLAGIGDDGAGERLDQRRLAGAVVADHAEDLARHEIEIGVIQRDDAAKTLDQAPGLQKGLPAEVVLRVSCAALMPRPSAAIGRWRPRR